ncbi:MAG: conjugal transfer protein TraG N-terminal domain-containing protein [Rickettsiaceae bacterium]|nr:conjugal transfer protein TraG N-terminal domain-containing protein [Rickettsiaceae bacterium]
MSSPRPILAKIGTMILIINSLLIPKTSMTIIDRVNKTRDHVDNLPLGFAIPAGILEQVGHLLTLTFEQAFNVPGTTNTNYTDYGMVFGARLIKESRNWKIKNPEFSSNMDNFITRCVSLDASIGHKYTINDLFESNDIWTLLKTKSSRLRKVAIKSNSQNELVTCNDAAHILDASFNSEIERLILKYAKTEFARAHLSDALLPRNALNRNNFLKQNIIMVFGPNNNESVFTTAISAESTLRQYMMMNSMSSYARTYGYARSSMTQENNWRISGDLASEYLPLLLSVMKGMIYASFIFIIPLMLLSGGGAKYLSYITIVASLQLWPSLNAILNMFIDLYSNNQMHYIIEAGGINFTNYSNLADYSDKIVAVASGLQMLIPYLAFSLVQQGVSGFIQLASSITAASASASNQAAQEVATNNKSFDNYSSGNIQRAIQTGFKTDFNYSYKSGAYELQNLDGSIERILQNGETIIQSGTGLTMSGGSTRFSLKEAQSSSIATSLQDAQNQLESRQASYHEAQRSTFSKAASFIESLAKRESAGQTIDYSSTGEEGASLQKAVNMVHTLREQYGYSLDQASEKVLRGDVDVARAARKIGGFIGNGLSKAGIAESLTRSLIGSSSNTESTDNKIFGIKFDSSASSRDSANQSLGDDTQINREIFTREDYNNTIRAASSEQFASSNNIDRSYSDDLRSSLETQKSAEKAMNIQSDRVQSLSKSLSKIQSMDGSMDQDMYHAVQQELSQRYNLTPREAHQMIERQDPRVSKIWNDISENKTSSLVDSQMKGSNTLFLQKNQETRIHDAEVRNKEKIHEDYNFHKTRSYNQAKNHKIDPTNDEFVTNNLEQKVDSLISNNKHSYNFAKAQNEVAAGANQEKVNKAEDKRWLSKNLGIGGPVNPSTIKNKENK